MIFNVQIDEHSPSESGSGQIRPELDDTAVEVLTKLDEARPLRDHLLAFKKDLGLRDRELVQLAGVSRPTISRWRKEGDAERPPALDDLRAIVALLIRTGSMRPRSVAGWLRARNLNLFDERPLDVLATGDFSRVLKAAEAACGARAPLGQPSQSDSSPPFAGHALGGSGLTEDHE